MEELGVPIRHLIEAQYQRLAASGRNDDAVIVSTSCTVEFIACDRIPYPVAQYRHRQFRIVRLADLADARPSPA